MLWRLHIVFWLWSLVNVIVKADRFRKLSYLFLWPQLPDLFIYIFNQTHRSRKKANSNDDKKENRNNSEEKWKYCAAMQQSEGCSTTVLGKPNRNKGAKATERGCHVLQVVKRGDCNYGVEALTLETHFFFRVSVLQCRSHRTNPKNLTLLRFCILFFSAVKDSWKTQSSPY